jgi:hypothetical protein
MADQEILKALAVAAELCGTTLSVEAAKVFAMKLEAFPKGSVLQAIDRAMEECKGRLTLADVISRIDDGRPSADEAWGLIPKSEHDSAVCTREMMRAMSGIADMIENDPIPGRLAFKAAYERELREARSGNLPIEWQITLGWSQGGRSGPVMDALAKGRITHQQAVAAIGHLPDASNEALAYQRTAQLVEIPRKVVV